MSRKALKVNATLRLHAVSCPGVRLCSNNEMYLGIYLFGHYRRTRLTEPVFPLLFQQKFKFEKVFYSASDPSEVVDLLEGESVVFELVQLSDSVSTGAMLLASYEECVRDFLYPCPQLSPTYSCMARELLMERELGFPGIAPKIEFSTSAIVVEATIPRSRTRSSPVVTNARHGDRVGGQQGRRSSSPNGSKGRSFVYPDENEATKGYQQETFASVSHSRSSSPGKLNHSELSFADSPRERRDFVVRKVDDSLTRRVPGSTSTSRRFASPSRMLSRLAARSPSPVRIASRRRPSECTYCAYPHSEAVCAVCDVYKRHTGRRYWGHTYLHSSTDPAHLRPSVSSEPATASRLSFDTVEDPYNTLSEDSDGGSLSGEMRLPSSSRRRWRARSAPLQPPVSTSRASSAALGPLPFRPVSPVALRRSFRERFGSARVPMDGRRSPDDAAAPTPTPPEVDELEYETAERLRSQHDLEELERELELLRLRR